MLHCVDNYYLLDSSSTYKLPSVDLTRYFPYLQSKTSNEEYLTLLLQLDDQTTKIKMAFSSLVFNLQCNIEEKGALERLTYLLKNYDKKFSNAFGDCKNVFEVFGKIQPPLLFFDFKMVQFLTKHFGSETNKLQLKKYKKMFEVFAKQRICECPSDIFGSVNDTEKVFIVKIDKSLDITVDEALKLQYEICKVVKIDMKLVAVNKGCVELNFKPFNCYNMINITVEQKDALKDLSVLSIQYGDNFLVISNSSPTIKKGPSEFYTYVLPALRRSLLTKFLLMLSDGEAKSDSGFSEGTSNECKVLVCWYCA